jgi:hypothetical protein
LLRIQFSTTLIKGPTQNSPQILNLRIKAKIGSIFKYFQNTFLKPVFDKTLSNLVAPKIWSIILSDIKFIVAQFWWKVISILIYYITNTIFPSFYFTQVIILPYMIMDDMKCHAYDCNANACVTLGCYISVRSQFHINT